MGWFNGTPYKRPEGSNPQDDTWWRPSVTSSPPMRLMEDYKRMCYLQWLQLPPMTQATILFSATASVSFMAGVAVGRMRVPWKRFTSINDIPPQWVGPVSENRKFVRGWCIQVSDGDTFRFLHIPFLSLSRTTVQLSSEKLSDVTLPIRVCTIDTPETAKFGKPGQPYGNEAKELLTQMIENRIVRCRFLHKDQYGRLVAEVRYYPWWPWLPWYYRSVDEVMLKNGLAEVYLGSGAVYGYRGKEYYLQLQQTAQQKQLGQWSPENRTHESAAQYKARTKS
jgi:micrococcal nuclease